MVWVPWVQVPISEQAEVKRGAESNVNWLLSGLLLQLLTSGRVLCEQSISWLGSYNMVPAESHFAQIPASFPEVEQEVQLSI